MMPYLNPYYIPIGPMGPIGPIGGIGRPDCAGAALAAFFFGAGRFAALALPAPDAIPNNAASDAPLPLAGALPLIAITYSYPFPSM
jgi:hypothetical protein